MFEYDLKVALAEREYYRGVAAYYKDLPTNSGLKTRIYQVIGWERVNQVGQPFVSGVIFPPLPPAQHNRAKGKQHA